MMSLVRTVSKSRLLCFPQSPLLAAATAGLVLAGSVGCAGESDEGGDPVAAGGNTSATANGAAGRASNSTSGGGASNGASTSPNNTAGRGNANAGAGGTTAAGGATSGSATGSVFDAEEVQLALDAHNAARAAVQAMTPLPELTWSTAAAVQAQDWAETLARDCNGLRHRQPNTFGENLAAYGSRGAFTPTSISDAVDGWNSEGACWTFGTISGTEQCDSTCTQRLASSESCGHYTQLVWRGTQSVGCGYATCLASDGFKWEFWACNYAAPGNVRGRAPF
jgi:pathogenesis-related protein 1